MKNYTVFLDQAQILTICLVISIVVVVGTLITFILLKKFNKLPFKRNKKEEKKVEFKIENNDELLETFGGKENIEQVELKGSRLSIQLKDMNLFNKEKIKEFGIDRILLMSNKIILIGDGVNSIFNCTKID